ncbi:MAG: TrmH family RNA methyltransferase [Chlamydiales bacterium]
MIESSVITSLQNPHVKEAVRLRNRRERDKTKLYLIEGYRELLRALQQKAKINTIYFCPELFLGSSETTLLENASESGIKLIELAKPAFAKISYRDRPDGLLGIGQQQFRTLDDCDTFLKQKINPILLIVETLEKPGNLGSIIRSADGSGADAIFVCDPATDIHNPNVIRASVGTFFSIPIFVMTSQEALRILQKHKIPVYATSPDATILYYEIDYTTAMAFAMGREQVGLSKFWLECATASIVIPMRGAADSLNVSNAATILLYETLRQRNL